jgi:hypothetical protein
VADSFLEAKRREITDRMRELKSAVDEYNMLEKAATALEGVGIDVPGRRRRGRPRGSGATTRQPAARAAGTGRRGRPRGSGTRSAQALRLVKANPGITIPELAKKMGIKQNYLYRVLPTLEKDGKVRRDGRAWHPKG